MKLKDYYAAQSIEEVVSLLNQSKKNVILGGTHWLKMGRSNYNVGIDISHLGLDEITETERSIEIGAFASLRQIETSEVVIKYAGILPIALSAIVGTQFRNTARIGATVYSRFGFSDVTAALLTLDSYVEIDGEEILPIEVYMTLPRSRHFITKIILNKEKQTYAYETMRSNSTSLPYMIVAISKNTHNQWRIVAGARPSGAVLAHRTMHYLNHEGSDMTKVFALFEREVPLHNNCFASKEYRDHLAKVFLERGVKTLWN